MSNKLYILIWSLGSSSRWRARPSLKSLDDSKLLSIISLYLAPPPSLLHLRLVSQPMLIKTSLQHDTATAVLRCRDVFINALKGGKFYGVLRLISLHSSGVFLENSAF